MEKRLRHTLLSVVDMGSRLCALAPFASFVVLHPRLPEPVADRDRAVWIYSTYQGMCAPSNPS